MTEAGACGPWSLSDSIDWARYERISNPVALYEVGDSPRLPKDVPRSLIKQTHRIKPCSKG